VQSLDTPNLPAAHLASANEYDTIVACTELERTIGLCTNDLLTALEK
jgi:hypothetical protein